jgi:hypothetical protein
VLFDKLKNTELDERNETYLGQIKAVEKPNFMAIEMSGDKTLHKNDSLLLKTPEGKKIKFQARFCQSLFGEDKIELSGNELGLLPYIRGASPKSMIYTLSSDC